MKRYLAFALAAMMAPTAHSGDFCEELERAARVTMEARQNGYPASELMQAVADSGMSGAQHDYFQGMIREAYKKERWSTKKFQRRAVQEFANRHYMRCLDTKERD